MMNEDKTELTTLRREPNREDEKWRMTKKLGTLLGETEEMHRRKQLAAEAFKKLWQIWSKSKQNKIGLPKRLTLYKAYILPILTYNSCTWALTATELEELEAFHRRQLRSIIGAHYPHRISNQKLYKRCNSDELGPTIRAARWRMLGHVLRM
jgi:hypothetical protein